MKECHNSLLSVLSDTKMLSRWTCRAELIGPWLSLILSVGSPPLVLNHVISGPLLKTGLDFVVPKYLGSSSSISMCFIFCWLCDVQHCKVRVHQSTLLVQKLLQWCTMTERQEPQRAWQKTALPQYFSQILSLACLHKDSPCHYGQPVVKQESDPCTDDFWNGL